MFPHHNKELVPALTAAFGLDHSSSINLDPIVLAVACFLKTGEKQVSATEMLEKGCAWFPSRAVQSIRGETERMKRFVATFPDVFEESGSHIKLHQTAFQHEAHAELDEAWYRIALTRLQLHDPDLVDSVVVELDDVYLAYISCTSREPDEEVSALTRDMTTVSLFDKNDGGQTVEQPTPEVYDDNDVNGNNDVHSDNNGDEVYDVNSDSALFKEFLDM